MKLVGLILAFVMIAILASLGMSFQNAVPAPTNATALAQYNNMTNSTALVYETTNYTMLIFVAVILIGAMLFMYYYIMR